MSIAFLNVKFHHDSIKYELVFKTSLFILNRTKTRSKKRNTRTIITRNSRENYVTFKTRNREYTWRVIIIQENGVCDMSRGNYCIVAGK